MNSIEKLQALKKKILSDIRLAAEGSDSQSIRAETARLTEVERLIAMQESLNLQVEQITNSDATKASSPPLLTTKVNKDFSVETYSYRQYGSMRRTEFLAGCANKGIHLTPKKGTIFENVNGDAVGIAFATERSPSKWFLGLPAQEVKHAVLICEPEGGEPFSVCFPNHFLQKYWSLLSESKGQKKFNVVRLTTRTYLSIPNEGRVQIDEYINRPELIN